jgi:hypothetical protein
MAKKRTRSENARLALRRLAEDEEVQKQLRTAAMSLREAWGRAARRPGSKAVEDKKLYDKVREAATSLSKAGRRLRPPPEPPKRRGRTAALVAASAGGAAYAVKKRRARSTADDTAGSSPTETATQEGATPTPSVPG